VQIFHGLYACYTGHTAVPHDTYSISAPKEDKFAQQIVETQNSMTFCTSKYFNHPMVNNYHGLCVHVHMSRADAVMIIFVLASE